MDENSKEKKEKCEDFGFCYNNQTGLALYGVCLKSMSYADEVLWHLQNWRCCKGYYLDVSGCMMALFYLGQDDDEMAWENRYLHSLYTLNHVLPAKVEFNLPSAHFSRV